MPDHRRIMLLVTENCNLRCSYCYEHQKNSKKMTFRMARGILDKSLSAVSGTEPVIIELFGGEAFVNFPLIKQIDEYITRKYSHLNILYETTTNGTLVHGEIKEWLRRHKERFLIALSLDGTKEMHNMNRCFENGEGSFDAIDAEFFLETWPGCPAKMTVSEKTLPYLAEGIAYLDRLGFKCDATLSTGSDWNQEKNLPVLAGELEKLTDYYIRKSEISLCTMLDLDLRLIFTPVDSDYRFCGAGLDMICFDTEGGMYPCQGFAPVSIGDAAGIFLDYDEKNFRFTDNNICKKCPWVRLCPNCYAANLQSTGDIQKVDSGLCRFYKMCILASAKIQCRRILRKNEFTHNDQLILKAVSYIQEHME